ncbi:alanyl-tRNA editing protein [Halorubrum salinarum]|uniref:Alanyl-tRNA editing protein n=1 Tax=Halorubrum salinarum TaxID=2739057 RepID=A0A7D3Y262_9EURY|nr:alanyl-tRNA editing protein [Halorubrum salinarum]QKG93887.1 alanyl-tRNA editing protein [Halorubrum salinarum]
MTERLYLADDAVTTFEATVERVLSDPHRIVLDRTHFYPTGGGQPHDTGTIRAVDGDGSTRWRVVDVEMRDTVYHEVEPADDAGGADDDAGGADDDAGDDGERVSLPEPGTAVACEVDADRRAAHSRYHTAQHLLSALLLDEFDAPTTGNQLYRDRARLDAEYDRFTDADLDRIEARLNELVADGRAVSSYTMDRETAEATLDTDRTRIDLLPDSIEELRIVEIAGADADDEPYDRTACAGTHVANTADIGEVVVTGRETKGPEEERVRFALADHVDAD